MHMRNEYDRCDVRGMFVLLIHLVVYAMAKDQIMDVLVSKPDRDLSKWSPKRLTDLCCSIARQASAAMRRVLYAVCQAHLERARWP